MNTPTNELTPLEEAWLELDESGGSVWDDIREYDVGLLQRRFDLTEPDATVLWLAIQSRTDPRRDIYKTHKVNYHLIGEYVIEALHQGLDGWTVEQGLVIQAFLADIAWGINHT